jgi:60 kDa SS-A/Ro ribonucleoprotein
VVRYEKHVQTRQTSQRDPIPGKDQVKNTAGGYVYPVDDFTRLHRFLVLGSEGGTYYVGERELTQANAAAVIRCIKSNGVRAVDIVREVSTSFRAPKNDPALFVLAMASALGGDATRTAAFEALPDVARTGTHLFQFLTFRQAFGGWGRGLRTAVKRWYFNKSVDSVAYQVLKYRQRDGWTHRDVLRKAHPKPYPEINPIFNWVTQGEVSDELPEQVMAFIDLQEADWPAETVAEHVKRYRLTREMIPTEYLNKPIVAEALLEDMPIGAMVRNLGNMTRIGVLDFGSDGTRHVLEKLGDAELIAATGIHPMSVLIAMRTYESGQGFRGKGTWSPVPSIVDALDEAFYSAFGNVRQTGKRILIGLDVSGSMSPPNISGMPLSPREAAAALAMVTVRTEGDVETLAFSQGGFEVMGQSRYRMRGGVVPFPISGKQRLTDVVRTTQGMPFSGTDCALPMLYATAKSRKVDAFVVLTDNETWAGKIHPSQALVQYRHDSGIAAKLIVVAMTSTGFTIADPADAGMLDVVGFDTATPNLMADFISGMFE